MCCLMLLKDLVLFSLLVQRTCFFFEAVRPEFIISTEMVKANNPLCKDLQIDCTSIGVELTDMGHNENDDTVSQAIYSS